MNQGKYYKMGNYYKTGAYNPHNAEYPQDDLPSLPQKVSKILQNH